MISEKIISNTELLMNTSLYQRVLKQGIFITPTDTVYGLSCDANNKKLVKKVRKLKQSKQPFSVIAPTKKWVRENCVISNEAEKWLMKLPGPYTLILKLKNKHAVSKEVYNKKDKTIGIRMPDHWITDVVKKIDTPLITTTANIHGGNYMTSLDNLNPEIKNKVDLIISVGIKKGYPSTIIHLVDEEKIVERK